MDDYFIVSAVMRFSEAMRRAAQRRRLEHEMSRVRTAVQKMFREQGSLFVRGMRKHGLRRFFESDGRSAAPLPAPGPRHRTH